MSPLVKNVGLAFLAAFTVSVSIALEAYSGENVKAFAVAAIGAAVWAGLRAGVAVLKEKLSGEPFLVDTEAEPEPDLAGE